MLPREEETTSWAMCGPRRSGKNRSIRPIPDVEHSCVRPGKLERGSRCHVSLPGLSAPDETGNGGSASIYPLRVAWLTEPARSPSLTCASTVPMIVIRFTSSSLNVVQSGSSLVDQNHHRRTQHGRYSGDEAKAGGARGAHTLFRGDT